MAISLFHIHGSLDETIVLGVDPSENFIDVRFNVFTKTTQRSHLDYIQSLRGMIEGAESVGYFGLSFDVSDKSTFSYIFKNTKAKHVIFYYEDELDNIANNIQKIVGLDEFTKLKNDGNIIFKPSKSIRFVNM